MGSWYHTVANYSKQAVLYVGCGIYCQWGVVRPWARFWCNATPSMFLAGWLKLDKSISSERYPSSHHIWQCQGKDTLRQYSKSSHTYATSITHIWSLIQYTLKINMLNFKECDWKGFYGSFWSMYLRFKIVWWLWPCWWQSGSKIQDWIFHLYEHGACDMAF